ncbi:MAG: hypothetical protein ACLR6J_20605 [Parabacteroides merdae]
MQHAGELLPENSLYMPHAGMFLLKTASHVSCQLLYKQKQPVASGGRLYG